MKKFQDGAEVSMAAWEQNSFLGGGGGGAGKTAPKFQTKNFKVFTKIFPFFS